MSLATYKAFVQTDPALFNTQLDVVHQDIVGTGTRGQPILSDYVTDATIRGLLRQLSDTSSKDVELARQLVPTATHVVVTRYNPVLTDRKKLRVTNSAGVRIFNIGHVNNCDELNIEHRVLCMLEVTPDEG